MQNTSWRKNIPPYMLGTWAWGSGVNGSKMVFGKSYDESVLEETFKTACKSGLTLFDTAEVYGMGNAEKLLGRFMKSSSTPVQVSTKYLPNKRHKAGAMEAALDASCERLEIAVPDIYWLHAPNNAEQNIAESIKLLEKGKIKRLGVSNFRLNEIQKAQAQLQKAGFSVAAVQNHFSLLSRTPQQEEIIKWCQENDVVYFAYMVLEQGALSGKYDASHPFPRFSRRSFAFGKKYFRKTEPLIDFMRELAEKYDIDTSQIPLLWASRKGTTPIVGVTKPEQVVQLSKASSITMQKSEIDNLEHIADETGIVLKASWEP